MIQRFWMLAAIAAYLVPGLTARAATNGFLAVNVGFSAYNINGVSNPDLNLVRGYTYTFELNASGHPFFIKTIQGASAANAYTNGVTGNGTEVGAVQFSVPASAPNLLFYNCQFHVGMTGRINIIDPPVVAINSVSVNSNLVIKSTGTDALNVRVDKRCNLMTGAWVPASIQGNVYVNGTNTTELVLPTGTSVFYRVKQTLP